MVTRQEEVEANFCQQSDVLPIDALYYCSTKVRKIWRPKCLMNLRFTSTIEIQHSSYGSV